MPEPTARKDATVPKKLLVVSGASARHSLSSQLGDLLAEETRAAASEEVTVSHYQLGQYVYEMAEFLEDGVPTLSLAELLEEVRAADAIITVSPVFNVSYSGVFKMFWDIVQEGDIAGTPLLMGATGGSHRHLLMLDYAMRPLFTYLRADVIPTGVYATSEDISGRPERFSARVSRAAQQLVQALES